MALKVLGLGGQLANTMFNPTDIIENIKLHFDGKPLKEMTPYYGDLKELPN